MNGQDIYFENIDQLLARLKEVFRELEPNELRDLLFFLDAFRQEHPIPKDSSIYVTEVPIEGLEAVSKDRVSEVLVGGIKKFESLKYPDRKIPPVVVLKGEFRQIIVHGELNAVEAYGRKAPLRAVVIDVGDRDPFEVFKLNPYSAVFLVSIIEKRLEDKGVSA